MKYSTANDIRDIYLLGNSAAKAGKKTIDKYLNAKDSKGLSQILRFHKPIGISNEETWIRDEIDYFMEYFSILSLGVFIGYVSHEDIKSQSKEIEHYLGNEFVKKYYYDNYPLILPQILYEATLHKTYFKKGTVNDKKASTQFQAFHSLNQTIDNDDINQFLWFLDGGKNSGYGIYDLRDVLSSTTKVFEYAKSKSTDALSQAVRGFLQYIFFLEKFKAFIKTVANEIDKAAYWSYHQYWFIRIRQKLKSSIYTFHSGLQKYANTNKEITDIRKKTILNEIQYSKEKYDRLLADFLFTDKYEQTFLNYITRWRNSKTMLGAKESELK